MPRENGLPRRTRTLLVLYYRQRPWSLVVFPQRVLWKCRVAGVVVCFAVLSSVSAQSNFATMSENVVDPLAVR